MAPTNPAPREVDIELLNLPSQPTIHHRLFLLIGRAGRDSRPSPRPNGPDGWINVTVNDGGNPLLLEQRWEVNDTWFKALIPLSVGQNRIHLTHYSIEEQKLGEHEMNLAYMPVPQAKKLRLVVLCAKDSPLGHTSPQQGPLTSRQPHLGVHNTATPQHDQQLPIAVNNRGMGKFLSRALDKMEKVASKQGRGISAPPSRDSLDDCGCEVDCPPGWRSDKLREGGDLAISRRLALQAYLWQAFHAEQMYRHGFGHRTFALDERSEDEVVSLEDLVRIEFVRTEYTVAQIRDPDWAQQNPKAKNGGKLHSVGSEAVQNQPFCHPGDACAILIGDAHWDHQKRLLVGHAAVGAFAGIDSKPSVGVMGSHWIWAAPQSLSEVTESFMNHETTDERYCCNDLGEGRTSSLTINIGSGAMLHEAGHALSNPHYPSGVMARGYIEFNRAFMTRETHALRGSQGPFKPITPDNDAGSMLIHRCQAVRATLHPAFTLPDDPPPVHFPADPTSWAGSEPVWKPTSKGAEVSCSAGISMIEIEVGGKFQTHIEWTGNTLGTQATPPLCTLLTPQYISKMVGFDVLSESSPEVKLTAVGSNLRSNELSSYRRMAIARPVAIPGVDMDAFGREVRNGIRTKVDDDKNHEHWIFLFNSAWNSGPRMVQIDIFSGASLDALGFRYADGSCQSVGRIRASAKPSATIHLNSAKEVMDRIDVRSGWWVDAARVLLSSGQATAFCGGSGGGLRSLSASQGEEIVGIVGSAGDWLDSLGVLVADRKQ